MMIEVKCGEDNCLVDTENIESSRLYVSEERVFPCVIINRVGGHLVDIYDFDTKVEAEEFYKRLNK